MEFKLNNMCDWEKKKAIFLMGLAGDLGISLGDSSYGEVAINDNSGYTYLWSEDYNFSLYMSINCELQKSDVVALWTNSEDGEERELNLTENTTLEDLEKWAEKQENSVNKD